MEEAEIMRDVTKNAADLDCRFDLGQWLLP